MSCVCEKNSTISQQVVPGDSSELMKIDAAAAILDTTGFTVRRLCRSGELKAVKVGQQWRVNRAALMAYAGLN